MVFIKIKSFTLGEQLVTSTKRNDRNYFVLYFFFCLKSCASKTISKHLVHYAMRNVHKFYIICNENILIYWTSLNFILLEKLTFWCNLVLQKYQSIIITMSMIYLHNGIFLYLYILIFIKATSVLLLEIILLKE